MTFDNNELLGFAESSPFRLDEGNNRSKIQSHCNSQGLPVAMDRPRRLHVAEVWRHEASCGRKVLSTEATCQWRPTRPWSDDGGKQDLRNESDWHFGSSCRIVNMRCQI